MTLLVHFVLTTYSSAGIAHIFKRVFQYTNDEEFLQASNYWCNVTLDMINENVSSTGFLFYRSGGYSACNDLIGGSAGVGLCLISLITHANNDWDRCVLLH